MWNEGYSQTPSGSLTTDLNEIVTPNRLLLGRNNQRSPTFVAEFETGGQQYDERLLRNSTINHTWYELLLKMVPGLVFRPKWFDNTIHKPQVGDYVLRGHSVPIIARNVRVLQEVQTEYP